jgi:predicted nicotinamide N-methyase
MMVCPQIPDLESHILVANRFFDQYPAFYQTSKTGVAPERMDFRYHLIIEPNAALLKNKRIIEIGAHDGRWTFAALNAGAAYVRGVEPRRHLVENAETTLRRYGIPEHAYDFVCNDAYAELERLANEGQTFDTALVLGFFYHTTRHHELIQHIAGLGCSAIVIDTAVLRKVSKPLIRLYTEPTSNEAHIFSPDKPEELVGLPSLSAVELLLSSAGYRPRVASPTRGIPIFGCRDYRRGRRFTVVGVR